MYNVGCKETLLKLLSSGTVSIIVTQNRVAGHEWTVSGVQTILDPERVDGRCRAINAAAQAENT